MACYEDLRQALAATAKERDELRRENTALKAICEKQADMTGNVAAMALELDDAKAEINRLNRENFEQSTLIASLRADMGCKVMERLTSKWPSGTIRVPQGKMPDALERLYAYEETGLSPDDIKSAFNEDAVLKLAAQYFQTTLDRLKELGRAEKEGRLAVLPCNFGDSIYRIRRFKRGKNWTKKAVHILSTTLTINNVANVLFGGVMGKTVFLTREEAEAALKEGGYE